MAQAAVKAGAAVAEAGIQIGVEIGHIFTGDKEDQDYRSGWTRQTVGQLSKENPGKNCLVVYTDHDASGLVNSEETVLICQVPNNGTKMTYGSYVFDSGKFVLKGDGGFLNWAFVGSFSRDGNTVNFNKL